MRDNQPIKPNTKVPAEDPEETVDLPIESTGSTGLHNPGASGQTFDESFKQGTGGSRRDIGFPEIDRPTGEPQETPQLESDSTNAPPRRRND